MFAYWSTFNSPVNKQVTHKTRGPRLKRHHLTEHPTCFRKSWKKTKLYLLSCENWYDYIILVSCYTHPTDRVSLQPFKFLKIHPSAYITQTKYAGINQIKNYNYMDVSFNFAVCNYLPPFRENIQSNWLL